MKRPRPYIPLTVRLKVIERQLGLPETPTIKRDLDKILGLFFRGLPYHLDHDPPLAARVYNPNIKNIAERYTPNANDPNFLIYRNAEDHRVKTFIRGEHGQYSDFTLIKRERRRQRTKLKRKFKWPKRKLQSRSFLKRRTRT